MYASGCRRFPRQVKVRLWCDLVSRCGRQIESCLTNGPDACPRVNVASHLVKEDCCTMSPSKYLVGDDRGLLGFMDTVHS